MKKKLHLVVLPLCGLMLTSCLDFSLRPFSSTQSSSFSYSEESFPELSSPTPDSGEGYDRPEKVNEGISFYDIGCHNGEAFVPSVGKIKLLVLPIEFSEAPFGDSRLKDIQTAFGGTSEETHYWESLKSYYSKSSYGALDLDFVFADPYVAATTPMAWFEANQRKAIGDEQTYLDNPEAMAELAMEEAIKSYKEKTGDDCKQFDSDGDGFIDACLMVYSCHDNSKTRFDRISPYYSAISENKYGDLFWAYQYSSVTVDEGDVASPIGNRYFWASYDFFYQGVSEGKGVDAHTLIHEFGHILGSDDYYNYGKDESSEPSGGNMMMAGNILDHDAFTKLSYGWIRPFVPNESATITIRPFESTGECVLLADSWNGTAFDEYVILQLYTPTGLNQLDAENAYSGRQNGFRYPGVIAYHVDARLVKGGAYDDGLFQGLDYLTDEETKDFSQTSDALTMEGLFTVPAATNTAQYDATNIQGKGYELIQLIQSGGRNTLRYGGHSSDTDLFYRGSTFSIGHHYSFFPETTKLNNGEKLPYEVYFEQVNSQYATLKITKKA